MIDLTLSDFYNMEIITRRNGTKTPLIDIDDEGHKIGLIGYNAPEGLTDQEIREDAFRFYKAVKGEVDRKMGE